MTLGLVDAEVLEKLKRGEGLDALGDHPLASAMGLEYRAADLAALTPVSGQAVDERRAELHIADGQTAEQKRIRAALHEPVQGDLTAELRRGVHECAGGVE